MDGEVLGGRYRLTRPIGQGGFGTVHEAVHVELGSKLAVKVLDGSRASEEAIARFLRESEALTRLVHAAAVKVHDRGRTEDGRLWIAMELVAGETLEARLRRGVLFPAEVVQLFRPLCELLAEAHDKGIVHRDIKPANVMLLPVAGGGWSPKLIDFGIAALRGDDAVTQPDLISGTPRYMAPEQWQGLAHADARSDIYGLGVVAYECLSGQLPLEAEGALAWLNKHRYEAPRDLVDAMAGRPVPRGMRDAIMKALRKDAGARPATAMALWTAMSAGLDTAVAGGDDVSRRRLLRWIPAVALPLAAAGGLAWRFGRSSSGGASGACPPLDGPHMPLVLGNWWRYRVIDPGTMRPRGGDKTIRLDRYDDIGGRKTGTRAFRLYRTDGEGFAHRWLSRIGDAVVWHHDAWFDADGTLTRSVYYEPWRLRVDDACAHRRPGARWTLDYDLIDVDLTDPTRSTTKHIREEWSVAASHDEIVVPAGTFRALAFHRRKLDPAGPQDSVYWFAPGVGKVKEDSTPEEIEFLVAYELA